jgi:hypothetical protein
MLHKNKDIKVTKDFLEKKEFNIIRNIITSTNFPWFYQHEQNPNAKDGFFFSHKVYGQDSINSTNYEPIIQNRLKRRINYTSLVRVQINLLTRADKPRKSIFHRDYDNQPNMTTGIYYINESNGYTEFESGEKIKSIPNMYVEFPTNIKHRAVSQTDVDCRCVINLNYYK